MKITSDIVNAKTDFLKVFLVSLLLLVAIIVPYRQVINFDFVGYDDELYVTENLNVQEGFTAKGIKWSFTTFHAANWHPLTWFSHKLDCELYRLNPAGHHWTNVEFHIANTLLLFFILFKMTGAIWRSAFVAALFAIHPLHVESVAWISERKDVLSTFFGLLAFFAYYHYVKKHSLFNYLLIILFLSMGLMAKPMLVTFPFVLLLLDFWPLKRFQFKDDQKLQPDGNICFSVKEFFRLILEKIPLFVPIVISSCLTVIAQQSSSAVKSLETFPLKARIANAFVSYVNYVLKAIWPSNLAVFYPHPGNTLLSWQIFGAIFLIAIACILAILTLKKYPYIAVGLFWFLGTLIPVIGLLQVGEQAMADRYSYIPLIGLFIIVAWGGSELFKKWHYQKTFLGVFSVVVLSALAICTSYQLRHWKNAITLFEHTIKVTKNNYHAQNNLGTAFVPVELDRAVFHYKEALKIKPDYVMAFYNLGTALLKKEKYDEAVFYFSKTLNIDPQKTNARMNLANVLFMKGKYDEAVFHYNEILKINPGNADAHYNLAYVLSTQGKFAEAVFHYKETLRIHPEHAKAHYNLGKILINDGQIKEALIHFGEAIKIKPDYVQAYNKLGIMLLQQGKFKKADVFFSKALQLDPGFSEARTNLDILRNRRLSK